MWVMSGCRELLFLSWSKIRKMKKFSTTKQIILLKKKKKSVEHSISFAAGVRQRNALH